jgi:hypothetical protein
MPLITSLPSHRSRSQRRSSQQGGTTGAMVAAGGRDDSAAASRGKVFELRDAVLEQCLRKRLHHGGAAQNERHTQPGVRQEAPALERGTIRTQRAQSSRQASGTGRSFKT